MNHVPRDAFDNIRTEGRLLAMAVFEIGKYRCQSPLLAQDSAGVLYEGTEAGTGAAVYIKQLPPDGRHLSAADIAQTWQSVKHATLATAYDLVEQEQRYLMLSKP